MTSERSAASFALRRALSLMVGNDVRDEPSEEEERDEGCADPHPG